MYVPMYVHMFVCMYLSMYIFLFIYLFINIIKHAPSLGSNTTCCNVTSHYW